MGISDSSILDADASAATAPGAPAAGAGGGEAGAGAGAGVAMTKKRCTGQRQKRVQDADGGDAEGHRRVDRNHRAMEVVRGKIGGSETGTPPRRTWEGDKKDSACRLHSGPCWRTPRGQAHAPRARLTRCLNWLVWTARQSTAHGAYLGAQLSCSNRNTRHFQIVTDALFLSAGLSPSREPCE